MTHLRLRLARLAGGLPASTGWPLFGGWLPIIVFTDPPCHADGRPWDGVNDPGYVTTLLVVGWLNWAVSVQVGQARRRKPAPDAREFGKAVSELDERIRAARRRSESKEP